MPDYAKLAQQNGGTATVDYDALARQHGGTVVQDSSNTPTPPAAAAPPGLGQQVQDEFDNLAAVQPHAASQGILGNAGTALGNLGGGMISLLSPLVHPEQALKGASESAMEMLNPLGTVNKIAKGQPTALGSMVKPFLHQPVSSLENLIGQVGGGIEAGAAYGGLKDFAGNFQRPVPSPRIVNPSELAARKLTNVIGPDPARAPKFISAAQQEVPNILDFARRSGNPLKTQLEWNKAAEGSAQEADKFYKDNLLGPNVQTRVPVDENYGGRSYTPSGENPQRTASLGDINDRIVALNKELNTPKLNAGDARTAMAGDAALKAEHDALVSTLHDSLSKATGVPPEEIANLRQRVGRSYELANDTNAAVTKRGLKNEAPEAFLPPKLGLSHIPGWLVERAQRGPTAIADRAFQEAIRNFPGEAQPLPQLGTPAAPPPAAAPRAPIWQGLEPTRPTLQPLVPNPADIEAQQATRAGNRALSAESQAAKQAAANTARERVLANRAARSKRLEALAKKNGQ